MSVAGIRRNGSKRRCSRIRRDVPKQKMFAQKSGCARVAALQVAVEYCYRAGAPRPIPCKAVPDSPPPRCGPVIGSPTLRSANFTLLKHPQPAARITADLLHTRRQAPANSGPPSMSSALAWNARSPPAHLASSGPVWFPRGATAQEETRECWCRVQQLSCEESICKSTYHSLPLCGSRPPPPLTADSILHPV